MSANQTNHQFTKVLCQDCLRVRDYTKARHMGDEQCECGGDFCGCPDCVHTINALLAGERSAEDIGCNNDIGEWNEEDGIAKSKEAA